jgi:hypothetical protein
MNQAVAIFLVLMAGCGSHAMRIVDAAAVDKAVSPDAISVEAGPVDTATEIEAGQPSCDDLQQTAQTAFEGMIVLNQGCASDGDCTSTSSPGRCLNSCYYALAASGASALTEAGAKLCAAFDSQECHLPTVLCPPPGRAVCDAGTCTLVAP